MDRELNSLQQMLPPKQRELEKAESELKTVEEQKAIAIQNAKEALSMRENGAEGTDTLEMRGRWLRGVEGSLRAMLEVDLEA